MGPDLFGTQPEPGLWRIGRRHGSSQPVLWACRREETMADSAREEAMFSTG